MARIAAIEHPNILPTYVVGADRRQLPVRHAAHGHDAARGDRQAQPDAARAHASCSCRRSRGSSTLHAARLIHRDFTLRNILVDEGANVAYLFDFDLAMSLDDIGNQTYRNYYKGRIFGSPGWSVAPETIDQALMDSHDQHVARRLRDRRRAARPVHRSAAVRRGRRYVGAADPDRRGRRRRRAEQGVLSRTASRRCCARPIEGCLERDPAQRFPSVQAVIQELRGMLRELPDETRRESQQRHRRRTPTRTGRARSGRDRGATADPTITRGGRQAAAESAVWEWGYNVERSARSRARPSDLPRDAARRTWSRSGQFPDANTFPKLVTVIDLTKIADPRAFVENWQRYFWPILKRVRQGLLTSLHKVIYDARHRARCCCSASTSTSRASAIVLAEIDLHIDGALALGFLVIRQVAALHEHGMAHNNISPGALLFKGVAATRTVVPAMIGLVEPAMGAEAMAGDCRALAGMVLDVAAPEPDRVAARPHQADVRGAAREAVSTWAFDKTAPAADDRSAAGARQRRARARRLQLLGAARLRRRPPGVRAAAHQPAPLSRAVADPRPKRS